MIQAKVIADSKNEFGNRITTMIVTMPRMILAEFNTHRMFSRNSASSRAIPFEKMMKVVEENPFIPIAWQRDHKGMQGVEYLTDPVLIEQANALWLAAKNDAITHAKFLNGDDSRENFRVTKQLCNRLLEPFMWHTVIVTATEWENFFHLRCPQYRFFVDGVATDFRSKKDVLKAIPDLMDEGIHVKPMDEMDWLISNKGQAEIHMMALAEAMWDAYNKSTPKELKAGEWHIPFGDNLNDDFAVFICDLYGNDFDPTDGGVEFNYLIESNKIKVATARCARVSYTVVGEEGKEPDYESDIKLHDRLARSGHWSPFEHCVQAMSEGEYKGQSDLKMPYGNNSHGWSGNFRGFIQYRKTFQNENITK